MTDPTAATPGLTPSNQSTDQNWQVPVLFSVLALLIIGGFYLYYQKKNSPSLSALQTEPTLNQDTTIPPEDTVYLNATQDAPTISIVPKTPEAFVSKLTECTPYETTFAHPLTGETLEKEILGYIEEKCRFIETMPNGGSMDCSLSESFRLAAAAYYTDAAKATSAGTSVHFDSDGNKITYTVNDNQVDNPIQAALDVGECKIVGY